MNKDNISIFNKNKINNKEKNNDIKEKIDKDIIDDINEEKTEKNNFDNNKDIKITKTKYRKNINKRKSDIGYNSSTLNIMKKKEKKEKNETNKRSSYKSKDFSNNQDFIIWK